MRLDLAARAVGCILLSVVLGSASPGFGQTGKARKADPAGLVVAGRVLDQSGSVIVGATVTLRSLADESTRDATSDATGRYQFDRVNPGSYLLIAFRDGFTPITREFQVAATPGPDTDLVLAVAGFKEEVTVSFTALEATSALKIDTALRDIPLAVQSYTGSFIKAIESTNVGDLYNYTTGVSRSGNTGIDFVIRGIRASNTGNIQYNGLPGLAARFGSPSTVNVERIEVLKGPSSVLYGQMQPGGIINIVTKKPQAERMAVFDVRGGSIFGSGIGSRGKYHVSGDLTGPLDKNRKVLYRFVASYDDENTFRDNTENKDVYLVPTLTWLGWKGGVVNLEFEYRRTRTSLDSGLVVPNNNLALIAPVNVRYQEPGDYLNEDGRTVTASVRKMLARGFTWNAAWRSVWHEDATKGFENVGFSGTGIVTRRDRYQLNERRYHYLDTTIGKTVATGRLRHKLLFGLNAGYEMTDFDRAQFATGKSLNVDLYHPVYGASPLPTQPETHRFSTAWTYAGYVNDQIEVTSSLKALFGLRYDERRSQEQELRINPRTREKNSHALLPLTGLVFQPTRAVSLYSSFATSFTPPPPGAIDARGENPFKPESARQFEAGTKVELNGGRGEASVSWFDITKNDVLITLVAQAVNDQIGQERSRGVEATYTQRILANWQVIAGYAYTDSKVTRDTDQVKVGSRIPNAARHGANFWSRYDFNRGILDGLGFGVGYVYTGDRAATIAASSAKYPVLVLPGYSRVDLGVYYVAKRYEITGRIVNLLDERYYESNLGTGTTALNIRPGSPRSGSLSLRIKF